MRRFGSCGVRLWRKGEQRVQDHRPFYTVGHSTRAIAELAELLRQTGTNLVVDVRTIARSRTNPQFNGETLPTVLAVWQIGYLHIRQLGGLRGRRKDQASSRNTFWKHRASGTTLARRTSEKGWRSYMTSAAPMSVPSGGEKRGRQRRGRVGHATIPAACGDCGSPLSPPIIRPYQR
jgi:hypothetical protein